MKPPAPFRTSATLLPTGTSSLPLVIVPSTSATSTGTALGSGRLSILLRSNMWRHPLCRFGTAFASLRAAKQEPCCLSIYQSRRSSNVLTGVGGSDKLGTGLRGWVGEGRTICGLGSILWLDGMTGDAEPYPGGVPEGQGTGALAGERGMCYRPRQSWARCS